MLWQETPTHNWGTETISASRRKIFTISQKLHFCRYKVLLKKLVSSYTNKAGAACVTIATSIPALATRLVYFLLTKQSSFPNEVDIYVFFSSPLCWDWLLEVFLNPRVQLSPVNNPAEISALVSVQKPF